MSMVFSVLLVFFMLATLGVVALGMANFIRGGAPEASARRSNKLMIWRVSFQGLAILMLLALSLLRHN